MVQKRQILIVFTGAMEIGGIERSLISLLDSIDYEKYDVDLFLYGHYGPLFSLINKNVNILPEIKELSYLRSSFFEKIKHKCYYAAVLRLRDAIKGKLMYVDNDETWAEIVSKCVPDSNKEYDLAIGYFLPFDLLNEKVKAKCKMGWIHTDYAGDLLNRKKLYKQYKSMDLIAAVSEQCKMSFTNIFPDFSKKTVTIENILSSKFILQQANAFSVENEMPKDGSVRLLSVGRFCEAKNFDSIPCICQKLIELGHEIKWYIIGFGKDEILIRKKIEEAGMQEYVKILGKKENPYPYMKSCDIYVQPSRYEGKCVSVIEAQILNKPVIITKYATSGSQLIDGYDGIVVPMDNEGCAEGISNILKNEALRKSLTENTQKNDYTNCAEIRKIYQIMEEEFAY